MVLNSDTLYQETGNHSKKNLFLVPTVLLWTGSKVHLISVVV